MLTLISIISLWLEEMYSFCAYLPHGDNSDVDIAHVDIADIS